MGKTNKLDQLYEIAEDNIIDVEVIITRKAESMSIIDSEGDCFIGIDPTKLKSTADETVKLAHELGHCITGSFYYENSTLDLRSKCERIAEAWSIKKLIPKDELIEAFKCGIIEKWDLAEYFNVTEDFIVKALVYYDFLSA